MVTKLIIIIDHLCDHRYQFCTRKLSLSDRETRALRQPVARKKSFETGKRVRNGTEGAANRALSTCVAHYDDVFAPVIIGNDFAKTRRTRGRGMKTMTILAWRSG